MTNDIGKLVVMCGLLAACTTNGQGAWGVQPVTGDGNGGTASAPAPAPATTTAGGSATTADSNLRPSPQAIAVARQLGLPAVAPNTGVAGPFDGPEGTIFYVNQQGLITFLNPTTYVAYMARLRPEGFVYLMAPTGFYGVQGNQVVELSTPPADIGAWPYAEPMAAIMIEVRKDQLRYQQAMAAQQSGHGAMTSIGQGWHDTNMQIINNIGGAGCIDHYEGPYFVGCY